MEPWGTPPSIFVMTFPPPSFSCSFLRQQPAVVLDAPAARRRLRPAPETGDAVSPRQQLLQTSAQPVPARQGSGPVQENL